MIIASCVRMAFCSFASLVGGTCGISPENTNVVHFVDLKNCDRDVKAYLKVCNARKLGELTYRAGERFVYTMVN